jgi:hypothetical protein
MTYKHWLSKISESIFPLLRITMLKEIHITALSGKIMDLKFGKAELDKVAGCGPRDRTAIPGRGFSLRLQLGATEPTIRISPEIRGSKGEASSLSGRYPFLITT